MGRPKKVQPPTVEQQETPVSENSEPKPEAEMPKVEAEKVEVAEKQEKTPVKPALVTSVKNFYVYSVEGGYVILKDASVRLTPVIVSYDEAMNMLKDMMRFV